ncbi:MAG: hypothetical protein A2166_00860 [Omnitrophica WOR_2 bacterium RBG_13_41_10]|nr:MAG: hypothetical protein A2166_00860 [Omnitrophica WOR_2 bacterium RBG_13_41_10]
MINKYRVQGTEYRALTQNLKFYILSFSFALCALSFALNSYAEEITILYTGETHAMIYHCNCPYEPDGGIARRVTLIKKLKTENPNTLLLDSGGFFAGGQMDEYSQNTQLDTQRTLVQLKAMELMKYDALAIGDDEFNFGEDFLSQDISKSTLSFVSANIKLDKVRPYLIKEFNGIKVGIIGLTNMAAKDKSAAVIVTEPKVALENALKELQKAKADIVILLSHLGENNDLKLIEEVPGIDVLIVGHSRIKDAPSEKIGSTLILRPSWQGRRLNRASLEIENKKIIDSKTEEIRLSDEISQDPDILAILPVCFSDANCKKEGFIGSCQEPGTLQAKCNFTPANPVNLLVITPKVCQACNTQTLVNHLKIHFPGLAVSYLYYPGREAAKKIKAFKLETLPAYILGKEIEKEAVFANFKTNMEARGDAYVLKNTFTGLSYYLKRKTIPQKFDLFISLFNKDTPILLETVREFNPEIHFLVVQQQDNFEAAGGYLETEECLRSVCLRKYYPATFWQYLECRSKNINSSWWDDCLKDQAMQDTIKTCARSPEAKELLRDNIALNKELSIMFGPTYLIDNQEIFSGVPSKEELKKILKR